MQQKLPLLVRQNVCNLFKEPWLHGFANIHLNKMFREKQLYMCKFVVFPRYLLEGIIG